MIKIETKKKEKSFSFIETQLNRKEDFKEEIAYSLYKATDLISLFIASTRYGVCFLAPLSSLALGVNELEKQFPKAILIHKKTITQEQVISFLNKKHPFEEKISLHLIGTVFQLKVWIALLSIPIREKTTYQSIAKQIGYVKAYRAVGSAIGRNPISILIPCHRVIRSDGKLGGYRWGKPIKEKLLLLEKNRIE